VTAQTDLLHQVDTDRTGQLDHSTVVGARKADLLALAGRMWTALSIDDMRLALDLAERLVEVLRVRIGGVK